MGQANIPVDLFNPGQVFACLGFLEAADVLIGCARGGFDWRDESDVRFVLRADGEQNPVETVLRFLAEAKLSRWGPIGYREPPRKPKKGRKGKTEDAEPDEDEPEADSGAPVIRDYFPAAVGDRMALPICLSDDRGRRAEIGHWAETDACGRNNFKLYAGNRSAAGIAADMLGGRLNQKGIAQLWTEAGNELTARPFDPPTPMGGSFNFDARAAWTAIDAGYSPNDQGHEVAGSPVVHVLAAWGLEHARPDEYARRKVRYAAWGIELPPMLARAALPGLLPFVLSRRFRFDLDLAGKNKVVTFATQENLP